MEVFCGGICDAIGDGMGKVRDWGGAAAGAAWNAAAGVTGHVKDVVRSIANAELTTLVLASTSSFASCNIDSHLFFTCTGIAAVDSINVGGFTLGDVYLLGNEFNPDIKLQPVSLRHERRHAEQWAAAGLSTPMNPLLGQSAMFGAYMANYVITGGNACNNLFEVLAGLGDGGYLGC